VTLPDRAALEASGKADARWSRESIAAAIDVVRKDGLALASMPHWLAANREVVQAAVQQNAAAIQYAALVSEQIVSSIASSSALSGVLQHMPDALRETPSLP